MGSCFALLLKLVNCPSCVFMLLCCCPKKIFRCHVQQFGRFDLLHNFNRQSATKLLQLQREGSCAFIAAAAARMHLLTEGGLCGINEKWRVRRREATKELNNERLHNGTRTCNANHLARFGETIVRLGFVEGDFRHNSSGGRAEAKSSGSGCRRRWRAGGHVVITSRSLWGRSLCQYDPGRV
jgi:hypothetical protein